MALLRRNKNKLSKSLKKAIEAYELPHFRTTTLRTLEVLRDEESTPHDIAASIQVDPGLCVRVLTLVNSAALGLRHKVEDLEHAVHVVGRASLESLAISVAVSDALPVESSRGFDPTHFWRAAARRAAVAQNLARLLCPSEQSLVFSAALLQDMGVPLLAASDPDGYGAILERWHAGDRPLHELEREAFDVDHMRVADILCERWQLPKELRDAIVGHHARPGDDPLAPVPVLISAHLRECQDGSDVADLVQGAEADHGVAPEKSLAIVEESLTAAEEIARLLV